LHEDEKALALKMRAVHTPCGDENDVATTSLLENWRQRAASRKIDEKEGGLSI
jgi:hypothetical protein